MQKKANISTLFLDVGGVLLTNGWGRSSRKLAAETFHLEYEEMNERHQLIFPAYELGKLTLEQYLQFTIFYKERSFTKEQFEKFMFDQSHPYPDMIGFIIDLKKRDHLKAGVVSNEGRELTEYRNHKFGLTQFVDFFIVSSLVHLRKPDPEIYHLALDVGQVSPEQVIYIDDRKELTEVASSLGLNVIHHTSLESTKAALFEALNTERGSSSR